MPVSTQLHIFKDAPERTYRASACIRSVFKADTIITRLLYAKSRLAPLKRPAVPRLELCIAAVGAQLAILKLCYHGNIPDQHCTIHLSQSESQQSNKQQEQNTGVISISNATQ